MAQDDLPMDPLSEVLSLLKPRSTVSAGFDAGGHWSLQFPDEQKRIKCYAVVSGECWLSVAGVPDAVRLRAGDCFVLPSGRPLRMASDMSLAPAHASTIFPPEQAGGVVTLNCGGDFFCVGSRFAVSESRRHSHGDAAAHRAHPERIGSGGFAMGGRAHEARDA